MKNIPNILSICRIFLSLLLLLLKPLGIPFFIIYIICGISDFLDGFIARKYKVTTKLGARLDSIADFVMFMIIIIVIYPLITSSGIIKVSIFGIIIIRVIATTIAFIKYKSFAMIHTYGNKITGFLVLLIPVFLLLQITDKIILLVCIIAILSAMEELLIQITSKELDLNRKSIFTK